MKAFDASALFAPFWTDIGLRSSWLWVLKASSWCSIWLSGFEEGGFMAFMSVFLVQPDSGLAGYGDQ